MNPIHTFHEQFGEQVLRHATVVACASLSAPKRAETPIVVTKELQTTKAAAPGRTLRLGFVPLTDCAPLVMAQELGLFMERGLRVVLSRELGWATIRDKVIHGELEAAHAVVGLPIAATLGLNSIPCECLTALVLNLHGNGITLSNELWHRGVRDGTSLRTEILRNRGKRPFMFGVVSSVSSHNFLMRQWLQAAGIRPGHDAHIVVVPPPQMITNLRAGHIDGFCVGEPWNSMAVRLRAGWCVTASAELEPGHPEKVLMVRRAFAEDRAEEHLALIAALLEACEWCEVPENREQLAATLSRPEYVSVPRSALLTGLTGRFDFGHGRVHTVPQFCVFHRDQSNEPSADKAAWILQRLKAFGLIPENSKAGSDFARRVFRLDLFDEALRLRTSIRGETSPAPTPKPFSPGLNRFNIKKMPKLLWTT